jgi:hypothetical protein
MISIACRTAIALAATASVLALPACRSGVAPARAGSDAVDASGRLHVPKGYQTSFQLLGSWAAAKDEGPGSHELHVVYAAPGVIDAYRRDGQVPDGAVLVKEVHTAATAPMTTGTISRADQLLGWFVMVRDRSGKHAPNDVWGDGWGWGWFDAGNPDIASRRLPTKDGIPKATLNYRQNCKPCHAPAEATEWIFIDGYPPLKR